MKSALVYSIALSLASAKVTLDMERTRPAPARIVQAAKARHQQFKSVSGSNAKSTGPLTNVDNYLYSCPVTIGKGQKFLVDLDTGSSDMWLRGPDCKNDLSQNPKDDSCSGKKVDLSDSTLVPFNGANGKPISFVDSYGSGNMTGLIYTTSVQIGDAQVKSMPIGVSTLERGFGGGNPTDGLLGLGGPLLSSTFFEVEKAKGIWPSNGPSTFFDFLGFTGDENKFGFYLNNLDDAKTGEFTMGGVDETRFKGGITYLPVEQGFDPSSSTPIVFPAKANKFFPWWVYSTKDITIQAKGSAKEIPLSNKYSTHAIADTGTLPPTYARNHLAHPH
ncbi:Vacuolar protease A [Kappamyces sp. JEL0680]|nr:Vacuolar protease A [Kappamyces sp. JEL0680]